jgi:putative sigma-54 modulation protein
MEVEFTARQMKVSKALRTALHAQAEEGMERIGKIMGKSAHASIVFSTQRHEQIVEVTVQGRRAQNFAATGKADTPESALREAIERAESQALRYRDRRLESKRLPKEEKVLTAPPVTRSMSRAAQADGECILSPPARRSLSRTSSATAKPSR